jgi:hypothetical protein
MLVVADRHPVKSAVLHKDMRDGEKSQVFERLKKMVHGPKDLCLLFVTVSAST